VVLVIPSDAPALRSASDEREGSAPRAQDGGAAGEAQTRHPVPPSP